MIQRAELLVELPGKKHYTLSVYGPKMYRADQELYTLLIDGPVALRCNVAVSNIEGVSINDKVDAGILAVGFANYMADYADNWAYYTAHLPGSPIRVQTDWESSGFSPRITPVELGNTESEFTLLMPFHARGNGDETNASVMEIDSDQGDTPGGRNQGPADDFQPSDGR